MYIRKKTKRILKFTSLSIIVIFAAAFISWAGFNLVKDFYNEDKITGLSIANYTVDERFFSIVDNYIFDENLLSLENYRIMEVLVSVDRVILADNCTVISVAVPIERAENIARAISGEYDMRPNEHDVLEEIIDNFEINISYAAIETLEDGVFYGHVILKNEDKILKLDIRPSDGVIIALRFGAPVYVSEKLIESVGQLVC